MIIHFHISVCVCACSTDVCGIGVYLTWQITKLLRSESAFHDGNFFHFHSSKTCLPFTDSVGEQKPEEMIHGKGCACYWLDEMKLI